MNKSTSQILQELSALYAKTTQGDWRFSQDEEEIVSTGERLGIDFHTIFSTQVVTTNEVETEANSEFTAAIHNHFPAIADMLRWIPVEERLPELERESEGYWFSKHVEAEVSYPLSIEGSVRRILVWDGSDWWNGGSAVEGVIEWRHLIL